MNKILEITEVIDLEAKAIHGPDVGMSGLLDMIRGWGDYDGYKVLTEEFELFILINNGQCCCESWGYFSTDDDLEKYIGSTLLDIELTDIALTTESIEEIEYLDGGAVQFVTFKTDRGPFQLAVYNSHNGYYGHGIYIIKGDEIMLNSVL